MARHTSYLPLVLCLLLAAAMPGALARKVGRPGLTCRHTHGSSTGAPAVPGCKREPLLRHLSHCTAHPCPQALAAEAAVEGAPAAVEPAAPAPAPAAELGVDSSSALLEGGGCLDYGSFCQRESDCCTGFCCPHQSGGTCSVPVACFI